MLHSSTAPVKHSLAIGVTASAFLGLAKQNMTCYQCLMELVDNAIAAFLGHKAFVQIILMPFDSAHIVIYICDWGCGMDLRGLENALQLGSLPISNCRLNEHGFGLNNALSSLTEGVGLWEIQTQKPGMPVYKCKGPFAPQMEVTEPDAFDLPPNILTEPGTPSTVIKAVVPLSYAQTLQSCGARCTDLATLRTWLVEHLGVAYRGYLTPDPTTLEVSAKITVTVGDSHQLVPPVVVPYGTEKTERFQVELGGKIVPVEYHYGLLDADKRDHLVGGCKAKYYYCGNQITQGIDIRLGRRVISTAMLDEIWHSENGTPLKRHNNYNEFVGELILPELPRGVLSTLNNKTGINPADPDWSKLFARLEAFPPPKAMRALSEKALQKRWMEILHAANPADRISDEVCVWPAGARIDVLRECSDSGRLILYELKLGKAEPLHIYQLRMYWDGLVQAGHQPSEGILLVQEYSANIKAMLDAVNLLPSPLRPDGTPSQPYHLSLMTHEEGCLVP